MIRCAAAASPATPALPSLPDPVLFGPATILADKDGSLRYFSTKHGRTPDFHNREHHVLVAADDL